MAWEDVNLNATPISLKQMLLLKYALRVYSDPAVRATEKEYGVPICFLPKKDWKSFVGRSASKLHLLASLTEEIIDFVGVISMEIMMWGFDHCEIVSGHFSSVKLWPDFQWKQQGRIDYLETAKALIQNENICPTERFILACNYCLEDDVHALWNKIPRDLQNRIALANLSPIIQLWIGWIMRGERLDWSQVVPACRRARSTFGATYKPVGLRMFAQHLTPEDTRQCVILSIERRVMHYDDLYYFFKKMSTEQQIKLLEDHAFRVMKSFLHWPLQNFFMRMIDSIWTFLSEEQFRDMLHVIICQVILKGWRDFDYLMLLEVFWNKSPPAYKRFVEKDPVYKLVTGLKDTVKIPWKKLSSIKCNCHSKPHILYIE